MLRRWPDCTVRTHQPTITKQNIDRTHVSQSEYRPTVHAMFEKRAHSMPHDWLVHSYLITLLVFATWTKITISVFASANIRLVWVPVQ